MQNNRLTNDPAEDIAPLSPFGAIDYGTTEDDLKKLAASYSYITQVTNRKEFDAAQAAVTTLTRARTKIDARRKELKAESLEFGRLVDSTAKSLIAVVTPEEQRIDAILEAVKQQKENERKAEEAAEKARVDAILARIDEILRIPADHQRSKSTDVMAARAALNVLLIDDSFAEFIGRAQEAKANVLAELDELRLGALHDERIAAQEKAERERIAVEQKAEGERLAAERAELARQQAELQAERNRIDADKRAEAIRVEQQRKTETEAAERAEAAKRIERLRPDAEKLGRFAVLVESLELPELSPESEPHKEDLRAILEHAANHIRSVAVEICA